MEDDTGLELSLGLSCGGSSIKSKGKDDNFTDVRSKEGDRTKKSRDDLKNFFRSGISNQDSGLGSQRSDSAKAHESFFNDLSGAAINADTSTNWNGRGYLIENRSAENKEDRPDVSNKRQIFFDEIHQQKKREKGHHASHISITTEDGSTAENEDVAEFKVDGSTSWLVSRHDNGSEQFIRVAGSSEIPKEVCGLTDSTVVDLQGQKRSIGSSENELKMGNLIGGVPFSIQNAPYSLPMKEPFSVASSTLTHPLAGMMHRVPAVSGVRPSIQPVSQGNMPIMLGYSPTLLSEVQSNNSWGSTFHSQQFHPSFAARGPPKSAAVQVISHNPSDDSQFNSKILEQGKVNDKQPAIGEGSSFQAQNVKENSINFNAKDAAEKSSAEGFSLDFSAIKPGISAEFKFGGSGSYPDLPWVSTKGPGPNGRTISGVTYKYSADQIRIVCACHGSHMSTGEFVRHAAEENHPDTGTSGTTLPSSNPSASAQS